MSDGIPRRVVAEIRSGGDQSSIARIGSRSIHQYWNLLAPHFRDVLLAPQRRPDNEGVSWAWKEPGDNKSPTVPEFVRLRRRLTDGYQSFANDPVNPLAAGDEKGERGSPTVIDQVAAAAQIMVAQLTSKPDAEFARFVCRTTTGLMIHSWGAEVPAQPYYPDALECDVSGTVSIGGTVSAGHQVVIENARGVRVAEAQSDDSGAFRFQKITPGRYRVRVMSDRVDFPVQGVTVAVERSSITGLELRNTAISADLVNAPSPALAGSAAAASAGTASGKTPAPALRTKPVRRRWTTAILALSVPLAIAGGLGAWVWWRTPTNAGGASNPVDGGRSGAVSPAAAADDRESRPSDSASRSTQVSSTTRFDRIGLPGPRAGRNTPSIAGLGPSRSSSFAGRASGQPSQGRTELPAVRLASTDGPPRGGPHIDSMAPADQTSPRGVMPGAAALADPSRTGGPRSPGVRKRPTPTSTLRSQSEVTETAQSGDSPHSESPQSVQPASSSSTRPTTPGQRPRGPASALVEPPQKIASKPDTSAANTADLPETTAPATTPKLADETQALAKGQVNHASSAGIGAKPGASASAESGQPSAQSTASLADAAEGGQPKQPSLNGLASTDASSAGRSATGAPSPTGESLSESALSPETPAPSNEAHASNAPSGESGSPADRKSGRSGPAKSPEPTPPASAPAPADPNVESPTAEASAQGGSPSPSAPTAARVRPASAAQADPGGGNAAATEAATPSSAFAAAASARPAPGESNAGTGTMPLLQVRASAWRSQLVRDTIVPTQPMRLGQDDSTESLRQRLWNERQSLLPAVFQHPLLHQGCAFEIPTTVAGGAPPRWRDAAGVELAGGLVRGNRGEIAWSGGMPPRGACYVLSGPGGGALARVTVDQGGALVLQAADGVRGWYWVGFERAPTEDNGPTAAEWTARLEWQLLDRAALPSAWQQDQRWLGGRGSRLDLRLDPQAGAQKTFHLALVDRVTGWGIVGTIKLSTDPAAPTGLGLTISHRASP